VITARDRKIMFILLPLAVIVGYWFMVLAPKRAESDKVSTELTKAQSARDTAEQQVASLNTAKASFASDYATVIRLGKAVPTTVDMPSLLVQLDRAARGTGITINDLKPGVATDASSSTGAGASSTAPTTSAPGGGNNPAAPGAPPAQSFPGKQAQKAGAGVTSANNTNQAQANKQSATPGATPSAGASTTPSPPGLQSVPLTFSLDGSFFSLADFFHRMKRFVRVVNDQIVVRGRLLTIESFDFKNSDGAAGATSKALQADVTATIYLSPPSQGATAGASSSGPASATGASPSTPSGTGTSTTPSTPTATATP
jgi:Tfp pilus assembly protein PilO